MPICQYCGRQLADGEICRCQQGNVSPYMNPVGEPNLQGVPYPKPQNVPQPAVRQEHPLQPGNDPYTQLYQQGQTPQQQKKNNVAGCLIAAAVILPVGLTVLGVLLAIIVPSVLGYVRKSQTATANSTAWSYYRAVTSSLGDLRAEGVDIGGSYIVSDLYSFELHEPFDYEDFESRVAVYTMYETDYNYFAVIEDGQCTYAVVWNEEKELIGTAPTTSGFREYVDYHGDRIGDDGESMEEILEDLYRSAYESVIFSGQDGEET